LSTLQRGTPRVNSDPETTPIEPISGTDSPEGRTQAVAELFRAHNESLLRFLSARLRSRQEAQEVAQEAYVRLLNLDQPGAISFLRAFLFKTAANLAVDRMRSQSRRQRLGDRGLFEEFRENITPERVAAGTQGVAVVTRLLEELPPKCRQAFLLNRVQGLQPAQIATQMGVSERTVRHYILKAFQHCREGLDAAEDHEGARHD
jgi:RNA polymerase sigma factor (sigma-70 family)